MDERKQLHTTQLFLDWSGRNRAALDRLAPLVYSKLHQLAHHYLNRERCDHTVHASALVNEAFLELVDQRIVKRNHRAHFFAIASQMMRGILVDSARLHRYTRRGRGTIQVSSLDHAGLISNELTAEVPKLDEALTKLKSIDPQQARVVELRFFGGLTIEDTAEVTKLPVDSVKREWITAKAWLYREIAGATANP